MFIIKRCWSFIKRCWSAIALMRLSMVDLEDPVGCAIFLPVLLPIYMSITVLMAECSPRLTGGSSPFLGNDKQRTFSNISVGKYHLGSDHASQSARDFVSALLVRDPRKRLTAEQSLDHRWILSHLSAIPSQPSDPRLRNHWKMDQRFIKRSAIKIKICSIKWIGGRIFEKIKDDIAKPARRGNSDPCDCIKLVQTLQYGDYSLADQNCTGRLTTLKAENLRAMLANKPALSSQELAPWLNVSQRTNMNHLHHLDYIHKNLVKTSMS
ncbi:DAPK3 [Cordylochernes scorpioides]|uniref:DAPK3 n=1 Tax=Cordylochernes scorpioides TaxID=51811 RepID=A0ABY6KG52_9ARAC|nr:DAPK3 [Cordylochernes scorpioides]